MNYLLPMYMILFLVPFENIHNLKWKKDIVYSVLIEDGTPNYKMKRKFRSIKFNIYGKIIEENLHHDGFCYNYKSLTSKYFKKTTYRYRKDGLLKRKITKINPLYSNLPSIIHFSKKVDSYKYSLIKDSTTQSELTLASIETNEYKNKKSLSTYYTKNYYNSKKQLIRSCMIFPNYHGHPSISFINENNCTDFSYEKKGDKTYIRIKSPIKHKIGEYLYTEESLINKTTIKRSSSKEKYEAILDDSHRILTESTSTKHNNNWQNKSVKHYYKKNGFKEKRFFCENETNPYMILIQRK